MTRVLNFRLEKDDETIVVEGLRLTKVPNKKFVDYEDKVQKFQGRLVSFIRFDEETGKQIHKLRTAYVMENGETVPRNQLETWYIMADGTEVKAKEYLPTVGTSHKTKVQKVIPEHRQNDYLVESVYVVERVDAANQIHKVAKYLHDNKLVAVVPFMISRSIEPQYALVVPEFKEDGTFQVFFKVTKQKLEPPRWLSPEGEMEKAEEEVELPELE